MNTTVAQHPFLWLAFAFLLGFFVEWILEVFYFRRPLADARTTARRRGEELDSERFAHGRTQAELKSKLAELDLAQKGRTLAESLLAAARTKLAAAETHLADVAAAGETLNEELDSARREKESAETSVKGLESELLDLRLRLAEAEAARITEADAAAGNRLRLAELQRESGGAIDRLAALETEVSTLTNKAQALEADLQASMRRHADAESSLSEIRGALAASQEDVAAGRKVRARLEADLELLSAKAQKLELAASDARTGASASEQKLKSRIEDVKQLTAQLGEASEELAALRARSAQLEANLAAAQSTRKTLEKELATRAAAPTGKPAADPAEIARWRDQVKEQERVAASWQGKAEELEAELLATTRAHQALEAEMERLRPVADGPAADDSLAQELELMTRERNELAAELAVLKAARSR